MKSSPQAESADLKPDGVRGRWWHETLRGLGKLEEKGLHLGVTRCAAGYGGGWWEGEVVARLVVGHVYQYLWVTFTVYAIADTADMQGKRR